MIDAIKQLEQIGAWVVAPVGFLELPLAGNIALLDQLLGGPVLRTVEDLFFSGDLGDILTVAPGESPLAGISLIGYGKERLTWETAMDNTIGSISSAVPDKVNSVAVLPPWPVKNKLPVGWKHASERFVPLVKKKLPLVRHWLWVDFLEENNELSRQQMMAVQQPVN